MNYLKRRVFSDWLIFGFFIVFSVFLFRQFFFRQLIPLPANLLVAFYSPFRYEAWRGYEYGVPHKPIGFDTIRLFYPQRKFTIDSLKAGQLPLWNPYIFAGNVHLATYQTAVFYPLNIVYFIFSLIDAWSLLVIIQPILTGWFTYLFLRSLSLSKKAGFFGAISFAFSGWMIAWWEESLVVEHSILWLPLALYGSNLIWKKNNTSQGFILLIISLTLSLLAGFPQMIIYLFGVCIIWNFFVWYHSPRQPRKNRKLTIIAIAIIVAIGIAAVQWLPSLEAYFLSPRRVISGKFVFESFLLPLSHLVTFLAPDFWGNPGSYNYFFPRGFYHDQILYLGALPLFFALYALVKNKDKKIKFWKVFSLVTLSLGFALPTSWIWYILRAPVLSVAHPGRIFALATFGLCVLSAYGLEHFLQKPELSPARKILFVFTCLLFMLWGFVILAGFLVRFSPWFSLNCSSISISGIAQWCRLVGSEAGSSIWQKYASISARNLILPSIFLGLTWVVIELFSKRQKLFYVFVVIMTLGSSTYFANKYLYFSQRQFLFPLSPAISKLKELAGYARVWSYGNAYAEPNIWSYYGLYSAEGYDVIFPQRFGELISSVKNKGRFSNQISRVDADFKAASESEPMTENSYRLRLLSLLGVKYVLEAKAGENKDLLTAPLRFPADKFSLAWENDKWRIWEYIHALPRAFWVKQYIVESDKQKIIEHIYDANFNFREKVILEEDPPFILGNSNTSQKASVQILTYLPQKVEYKTDTSLAGYLVVTDNDYPGWKANIDGEPVKIYRANYSFRAIALPAGQHLIRFTYDPPSVKYGIYLSGISLLFLIIIMILRLTTVKAKD